MLFGLIDRTTSATSLKDGLDRSAERLRSSADRVSKASLQNGDGFSLAVKGRRLPDPDSDEDAGAAGAVNDVNIEEEMVGLADEQLRFLMTAKLLEKTYASLRGAIRGQG